VTQDRASGCVCASLSLVGQPTPIRPAPHLRQVQFKITGADVDPVSIARSILLFLAAVAEIGGALADLAGLARAQGRVVDRRRCARARGVWVCYLDASWPATAGCSSQAPWPGAWWWTSSGPIIGAAICLVGVAVIMYAPRGGSVILLVCVQNERAGLGVAIVQIGRGSRAWLIRSAAARLDAVDTRRHAIPGGLADRLDLGVGPSRKPAQGQPYEGCADKRGQYPVRPMW